MQYLFYLLSLFICACFQGTLLNGISILGVTPNFFIIYVSIVCFLAYKHDGIIVSVIFGFILDVLTARYIGVYTVLFLIAAYFVSSLSEKVFNEPRFYVQAIITFVVSVFVNSLYYLIVFFITRNYSFGYSTYIVLLEAVYNTALSIPVYFIVKCITRGFYKDKGEYNER